MLPFTLLVFPPTPSRMFRVTLHEDKVLTLYELPEWLRPPGNVRNYDFNAHLEKVKGIDYTSNEVKNFLTHVTYISEVKKCNFHTIKSLSELNEVKGYPSFAIATAIIAANTVEYSLFLKKGM